MSDNDHPLAHEGDNHTLAFCIPCPHCDTELYPILHIQDDGMTKEQAAYVQDVIENLLAGLVQHWKTEPGEQA